MAVLSYLDAGSGSLIISAIVAGFAGIGVIFRMGRNRVAGVFSPARRAEARAAKAGSSAEPVGAPAEPRS